MKFDELTESMYSKKTYEKLKKAPAVKVESNNDIYVDISEERANMLAVTLKGRTALIPAERAQRIAEKLMQLSSTMLQEQEVDEDLDSDLGLAHKPEEHTKNDPPGTSNKNVSARKGFVG